MKKIRLDLEALDVVSFATDGEPDAPRGTIHGRDSYYGFTYGGYWSCQGMCNTNEYDTCREAGPSVGPSCDWDCAAQSVGCYPFTQVSCPATYAETCAETCS